jgi:hypothetical protein
MIGFAKLLLDLDRITIHNIVTLSYEVKEYIIYGGLKTQLRSRSEKFWKRTNLFSVEHDDSVFYRVIGEVESKGNPGVALRSNDFQRNDYLPFPVKLADQTDLFHVVKITEKTTSAGIYKNNAN